MIIEKYLNGKIKVEKLYIESLEQQIDRLEQTKRDSEIELYTLYMEMQRVCTHPNEKTVMGFVYCDQCNKVLSEPGA